MVVTPLRDIIERRAVSSWECKAVSLRFELVNCGCNATSRHNRIKGCQQLRVSSSKYFKNIALKKDY